MAFSVCWALSCLLGFTCLFGWHNYTSIASDSTNISSPSFNSPTCTFLSMIYFNSTPAGHDLSLHANLLELAGLPEGELT